MHPIRGLYAVVSSVAIADLALQGRADVIQLRIKEGCTRTILAAAKEIALLCRKANVPFILNDRCDIALEVDADGVHLGQTDLPIAAARRLLGPHKIIGGSSSNLEQALAVEKAGADYVALGHVFPTTSKQKDYPPIGIEILVEAKQILQIPLIAIGGISEKNVHQICADGIAVISAISKAADPKTATKRLKDLCCKSTSGK